MVLITPGSLRYVICLSLLSRVILIILQAIFNLMITDHNADAYRNRYHQILSGNNSMTSMLQPSYRYIYYSIHGLTKWDSQYLLEIANDGYVSERHLAFLPLYPIVVSFTRQLLFEHKPISFNRILSTISSSQLNQSPTINSVESYISSAFVGVALNNFILFPLATISLYALTKSVKGLNEKYARDVVWWFCFNPASIFFSACYTECLFAALTFTATFMIEYKLAIYLTSHRDTTQNQSGPLSQLNRLLYVILPSLPFLALSTATRSNGLVSIGFIVYQLLLKYAPIMRVEFSLISGIIYLLEFIQDFLVLFMSAAIAASGYISFQTYSYFRFCHNETSPKKGELNTRPEWCDDWLPHPYGLVQAKYWDVGLFRYYQLKQLPNFALAMPIAYLALAGSLKKSKNFIKTKGGKKQLAYYVQAIVITLLCSVTINVQVMTRLLASSCPAIYWICADLANESRAKSKLVLTYFTTYFVLGIALHSNFYPWT